MGKPESYIFMAVDILVNKKCGGPGLESFIVEDRFARQNTTCSYFLNNLVV